VKLVIYTAITAGKDSLHQVERAAVSDSCDYVCFSDERFESDVFDVRPLGVSGLDDVRRARFCKVFPHLFLAGYDASIWMDGNFKIVGPAHELFGKLDAELDIAAYPHEVRDCIYDEMKACDSKRLDFMDVMERQVARYREENYPEHNGLFLTGVMVRRHTESVKKAMEMWWHEIANGSRRDQLSFNYVLWKLGIKAEILCRDEQWKFLKSGLHHRVDRITSRKP